MCPELIIDDKKRSNNILQFLKQEGVQKSDNKGDKARCRKLSACMSLQACELRWIILKKNDVTSYGTAALS